jgi:hypothetical protein
MAVAEKLADPRVLLSCPFGTFYHRPEKALFEETPLWRDLQPLEYFLVRFSENACFQTDAWLVSRELTEANGPWTDFGSPDDDGEYFCRMVTKSAGVKFVPDARSYYRVGNVGSLANTRSAKAVAALFTSKEKCIRYLLSMEDSPRTRAASVHLLQTWMFDLFGHDAVITDAMRLAAELGGTLQRPVLKWKYKPIQWLFGYEAAFRARCILPRIRVRSAASIDQFWYGLSRAGAGSDSPLTAPEVRR